MRSILVFFLLPATGGVIALPDAAQACGLTPHVGPTGLISECDGKGDAIGPWRVALQGGALRSDLTSSAGAEFGIDQLSTIVRGEYRLGSRFAFGLAGGSILGGSLRPAAGGSFDLGIGWTGGASFSALALAEREARPFILASVSFAYSETRTQTPAGGERAKFVGRDVRLGVAVGKSFGFARPYVAARVFGGGFRWEGTTPATTGGDSHKYQVGAGASLDLPSRFDLLVELMPLGEQSLTAGVGRSF